MPELHWQLKRLTQLQDKCGTGPKKAQSSVDTSKMTEYERQQYKLAEQMQRIRGNILELDNMPDAASTTKKVELRNQIRKDVDGLHRGALDARKAAKDENRKDEYDKLFSHVTKTQQLWKARFQEGSGSVPSELMSPKGGGNGTTRVDEEMSSLSQPMVNLRDDAEFGLFFEQAAKRDVEIDQALDMVSAGVTTLHQQAKSMGAELKVQAVLLDTAGKKMDNITSDLTTLNKKLKKTIKEVEKDKMCIYLICCILLIALAGTIYFVMRGN